MRFPEGLVAPTLEKYLVPKSDRQLGYVLLRVLAQKAKLVPPLPFKVLGKVDTEEKRILRETQILLKDCLDFESGFPQQLDPKTVIITIKDGHIDVQASNETLECIGARVREIATIITRGIFGPEAKYHITMMKHAHWPTERLFLDVQLGRNPSDEHLRHLSHVCFHAITPVLQRRNRLEQFFSQEDGSRIQGSEWVH